MAAHVEPKELTKIPGKSYASLRPKLLTGNLFFCSGNYFVSQVIREFSESPWSHVGIIIRFETLDRVLLLESVEDTGVRLVPLSKYLDDYEDNRRYDGVLAVAEFDGFAPAQGGDLTRFAMDELGQPYDKDEIAKIVARIALGIGRPKEDREYICSELVYECFRAAGYRFKFDRRGFISPENIWIDSRVKPVARITSR
jgi:uncharacterized protein YycO